MKQIKHEVPTRINYLYPEIKVNATAPYIDNETIFKTETEN